VFTVKKDNLNWWVPKPILDRFNEAVTRDHGKKGKWYGAVAAMMMYLEADEQTRADYRRRALQAQYDPGVEEILAEIDVAQQPAKPAKKAAKKASKKTGSRRRGPTS